MVGPLLRSLTCLAIGSWPSNGARCGIYLVEWALNLVYLTVCFKACSYYSMDRHFLFTVDYNTGLYAIPDFVCLLITLWIFDFQFWLLRIVVNVVFIDGIKIK